MAHFFSNRIAVNRMIFFNEVVIPEGKTGLFFQKMVPNQLLCYPYHDAGLLWVPTVNETIKFV